MTVLAYGIEVDIGYTYNIGQQRLQVRTAGSACTRVVPEVMSNFFFACELGTADEGECGGRWNQLLCYP